MKAKIFIDGSEGTTGLRIYERFQERDDVELMKIDPELRKDPAERKKMINASDITFLCLPDAAAKESVAMVENDHVRILDTSTAHRTEAGWAYGFPELSARHKEAIQKGNRIAVPGCHATGFISLAYPMISGGIAPADYPMSGFSLTGYSGGGKKMIAEYEGETKDSSFLAPREYALSQQHKHLKEMKAITGLSRLPLFSPIVDDYYSGMVVSLPFYQDMLNGDQTPEKVHEFMTKFYEGQKFIKVMPFGAEAETRGFISGNECSGWDGLRIFVTGNEDRILLTSQFDNLGKGASGAAIQCLNLMLGCDEATGLHL